MNVDTRARRAAAAVRSAVEVSPPSMAAVAGRRRFDFLANVVLAGAAAVAVFFLAGFVRGPEAGDAAQPSPVPTPAVVETTTTTTTAAETTTTAAVAETVPTAVPIPQPAATSTTTTVATTSTTTTQPGDTTPPEIIVTVPEDGAHTDAEVFQFRGVTEPGATVFSGVWQADVDSEGHWALVLVLTPGRNTVRFTAADASGNEASAAVTITYDEPGGDEFVFTAHQTYGSCAENPPYDVFYGTGTPGTVIAVASPYGGGSTEVDDSGNWEIRVEFPESPFDEMFEVVIEGEGGRKAFTFIHTG